MNKKLLGVTMLVLELLASAAHADCACRCVNGEVQAICTNSLDLEPICAPMICPLVPPSVRPLDPPTLPPIGTSYCRSEQLWNQSTMQYEWRRICQ
jgi:hypothetical protein